MGTRGIGTVCHFGQNGQSHFGQNDQNRMKNTLSQKNARRKKKSQ
jgi:hypothetical protein